MVPDLYVVITRQLHCLLDRLFVVGAFHNVGAPQKVTTGWHPLGCRKPSPGTGSRSAGDAGAQSRRRDRRAARSRRRFHLAACRYQRQRRCGCGVDSRRRRRNQERREQIRDEKTVRRAATAPCHVRQAAPSRRSTQPSATAPAFAGRPSRFDFEVRAQCPGSSLMPARGRFFADPSSLT
jgi:hypothetical protein